jgi:hypothetical protein
MVLPLAVLADLNSVVDYIAAHSPRCARRVQAHIQSIIELLLLYHPDDAATGRDR